MVYGSLQVELVDTKYNQLKMIIKFFGDCKI